MSATPFAVLMPIGPGEQELSRLRDTAESLFHFEPGVSELVIVDDVRPARDFSTLPHPPGCRVVMIPNPRDGKGNGWSGGLTAGVLAGFAWIAQQSRGVFAVKLDTDALVVAPFAAQVAQSFAEQRDCAQLGTYTKTPNRKYGLPEDYSTAPALRKLQRRFTVWRRTWRPWPRLQCTLFGRDRRRAGLIRAALRHGYHAGLHCQGGAYAVSTEWLRKIAATGALADPLLWIWTPCCEDIVMTMNAYAAGGLARDFNDDGQTFGVLARGLPDSLERIVERGFGIIHSVKDFEQWREAETRSFFRARRSATLVTA